MMAKYGESYDAEYVDRMVGKVLAPACAAVTLAKPNDPIEFLSLWLHKYCDNVATVQDYQREKAHEAHKEVRLAEVARKKFMAEEDLRQQQHSAISHMKSITDDPYALWETCSKAISTFTGCDAAYVAVVINKIFEPKPEKKKKVEGEEGDEGEEEEEEPAEEEGEEGDEGEAKDVGSDNSSVDDDQEVEEPDAPEEGDGEEGDAEEEEPPVEGADGEGEETKEGAEGAGTLEEPTPPKPPKPPKPLNYKRKKLLYVAATRPSHIHMLNRQLDIKSAPVTYDVLTEGLLELHIPNVLYKEGICFLGGVPRVGAYFVVPITVEFIAKKYLREQYKDRPKEWFDQVRQKQVVAVLCCDTLKAERMGNGRPFQPIEQDFIKACAAAMSRVLDENNKDIEKDQNTSVVIEKYKNQLKEIKVARKAQLEKERDDAIKAQKAKEKEERRKRFEDAHKAWEERQAIKAESKKRKDADREAKVKAGEEVPEEEEPAEEEEDLEPVPEPEPEEEEPPDGEEAPAEETAEEGGGEEEEEEGEEGEKPKDGLDDAELEPDPFQGLDEGKAEGEEGEEGEEGSEEEVAEEEAPEEEEPDEPEEAELEAAEGKVPAAEGEGEEEGPKVEESEDVKKLKEKKANNAKKEKEMKKEIKTLTKLLKGFEKTLVKAITELDAISKEAEKYEKALFVANGVVVYLKTVQGNVFSLLNENKKRELDRIKRWPYPNRHVQRVLKALLHLLGHKKLVIDDWSSARKLFNRDLLEKVLKHYDPLAVADPDKWKAADSYLAGLKDEKLVEQACIGFLLQQWILGCKKTTAAGVKYHTIKTKFEEISKDFAEKELAKIMCEVETQLAQEKLKKMIVDEEARALKEKTEIDVEEKRLADIAAAEATAKEAADKAATDATEATAAAEEGGEAPAEGA